MWRYDRQPPGQLSIIYLSIDQNAITTIQSPKCITFENVLFNGNRVRAQAQLLVLCWRWKRSNVQSASTIYSIHKHISHLIFVSLGKKVKMSSAPGGLLHIYKYILMLSIATALCICFVCSWSVWSVRRTPYAYPHLTHHVCVHKPCVHISIRQNLLEIWMVHAFASSRLRLAAAAAVAAIAHHCNHRALLSACMWFLPHTNRQFPNRITNWNTSNFTYIFMLMNRPQTQRTHTIEIKTCKLNQ